MPFLDEQIAPLDQLDAHLLGEERVLEVGAVVLARRQQHCRGIRLVRRLLQRLQQQAAVVVDGPHVVALEQFRKQPHHHPAVGQHVGDAGRHPQVVLEDVEVAVVVADQVDPDDMGVAV